MASSKKTKTKKTAPTPTKRKAPMKAATGRRPPFHVGAYLAAQREAAGQRQEDVAKGMRVLQTRVSHIERQEDVRASVLFAYLRACGQTTINLAEAAAASPSAGKKKK